MIVASDWRPRLSGTLQGFATLTLSPSGLVLHDCTYHRHEDGREWVGLPGRPQIDRAGCQRKDPATGKALYVPVVEIKDREQRGRFQGAALAAVHALLERSGDGGEQ